MITQLRTRTRAFALPITLALLALLVLSVLALSMLVKSGARVASATSYQEQARQNALLALDRAVAALQSAAGPDRRATARAESIAGCAEGKRYWTGVWDENGALVGWLVSGPDNSIRGESVEARNQPLISLVGTNSAGTTTPAIAVQADPIFTFDHPGATPDEAVLSGRLAYWIGDEGVKATVRFDETMDGLDRDAAGKFVAGVPTADSAKRLRQMLLPRPRIDLISDKLDPATATTRAQLLKVEALGQLPFAATGTVNVASQFHDLTVESLGVLSDPVRGGLKRDVSGEDSSSGLGAKIDSWRKIRPQSVSGVAATHAIAAARDGFAVGPVITECAIRFRFFRSGAANASVGNLSVRCQMQVELWNPYSSTLAGDGAHPLQLKVTGLPTNFTVQTGTGLIFTDVNLQAAFDAMDFSLPASSSFAPGNISVYFGGLNGAWTSNSSATSTAGNSYDFGSAFAIAGTNTTAKRWLDYSHVGRTTLTVALSYGGGTIATYSPATSFAPITYVHASAGWTESSATSTTYQFGYGYSLRDSFDHWANGAAPGAADPRAITMTGSFVEDPDAAVPATPWRSDPRANAGKTIARSSSAGSGIVFYNAASGPSYVLFELPRQDLLSLGALQHVPGSTPGEIGNPWGGDANALFDTSFMSTLPQTDPAWITSSAAVHPPAPNAFLRTHRRAADFTAVQLLDPATAAAHLFVRGAFNVNSTSAKAWKMALGGAQAPAGYTLPSSALSNAFFRHSHSAQEFFASANAPTTANKPTSVANARKQGVRDLTAAQIDALANAIALLNRNRARPALSLQEFLSAGVISQALDPANAIAGETGGQTTNRQSINNGSTLVAGMPSYLSQADIITSIAPFIMARSDTFRIRAYGDVVNPADPTRTESRAYCEAIVQRLPEYYDSAQIPTTTSLNTVNARYGRRFKVLSFRWLGPGDI